jgi:CheY-like chemotaxis protein/tetratricopeptide (TPR) repeat protein
MASQTLFLIDPNLQNLSVMETQLQKYGYDVVTISQVKQVWEELSRLTPDLIISELGLDRGESALDLCRKVKADAGTKSSLFVIITDHEARRLDCLTAGADDVLVKPVYMAELRDRVEQLLQRRQLGLEPESGQRFFGRLEEMGLLDLLQVIDVSQRSGMLSIEHKEERGALWFSDGVLHDAEMGPLTGRDAIHRLLTWEFGQYEFDFNAPTRPNSIQSSLDEIKSTGLRYVIHWNKMCELLPPLETVFRHDPAALAERPHNLGDLPKKLTEFFDGRRTILEVINHSDQSDLDVLKALTQLYFEGLVYEVHEVFEGEGADDEVFIDPHGTVAPPVPEGKTTSGLADGQSREIPEEGQDLLAEIYAAPSSSSQDDQAISEISPPPIPEERPEYDDQADETYSTLFGINGSFDYAEEEATFFDVLNQEGDDLRRKPQALSQSPQGSNRIFWVILLIASSLVIIYASQDRVMPLDVTERTKNYLKWHKVLLEDLPRTYQTKPVDMPWKIKIKPKRDLLTNQEVKPDGSSGIANPFVVPTTQKLNSREKKRLKSLVNNALKLKAKRDPGEFEHALKLTRQALALQPTDPDALLLAAIINMDLSKNKEALQHLEVLVQVAPAHHNANIVKSGNGPGVVYLLIGITLQQLKLEREALKYYETYLRKFPKASQSREIRAIVRRIRTSPK